MNIIMTININVIVVAIQILCQALFLLLSRFISIKKLVWMCVLFIKGSH